MWRSLHTEVARILCVALVVLIGIGSPYLPVPAASAQSADRRLAERLVEEGISAYQKGQYDEAIRKLTQARTLLPTHSSTALYLGLAYLRQHKTHEAIAAWQEYVKLQPHTEEERRGGLPQTIPQYLTLLLREENHRIAREAVAREQQIGPGDPRTVAVTYYRNLGSPQLAPLQKGLTALLISDISQVKDLKVVERDRLQALLEEIKLGSTGMVDQTTAPKVGRLLGAGKIATGSYMETEKAQIRADSVLVESTTAQMLGAQGTTGTLQKFYELEKGLALAILRDLGYDEPRLRSAGVLDTVRRPQTTSLPALTAFSNGLDAKDRGAYGTARAQFQQALRNDPNFALARIELLALPVVALTTGGIIAGVQAYAPATPSATAGLAAPVTTAATTTTTAVAVSASRTGGGMSTATKIGLGALLVGGAGAGIAVAAAGGGGGGDGRRCGNNDREGEEQCDGSDLAGQSCASLGLGSGTLTCFPANSSQECQFDTTNCIQPPQCGNGTVEQGEQCDDGNADNTDACLTTCVDASCGDGFTQTGVEQCDDGNADNTDACLTTCVDASCNDGFIQTGVEACDPEASPNGCSLSFPVCDSCVSCISGSE